MWPTCSPVWARMWSSTQVTVTGFAGGGAVAGRAQQFVRRQALQHVPDHLAAAVRSLAQVGRVCALYAELAVPVAMGGLTADTLADPETLGAGDMRCQHGNGIEVGAGRPVERFSRHAIDCVQDFLVQLVQTRPIGGKDRSAVAVAPFVAGRRDGRPSSIHSSDGKIASGEGRGEGRGARGEGRVARGDITICVVIGAAGRAPVLLMQRAQFKLEDASAARRRVRRGL